MEEAYDRDFDPDGHPVNEDDDEVEIGTVGSRTPTVDGATVDASQPARKNQRTQKAATTVKRRSWVWEHFNFTTDVDEDGKEVPLAVCKWCNDTKYKAYSVYGTSNATTHIQKKCVAYKKHLADNPVLAPKFDQKTYCRMFAEAIMFHSYPFNIVEHVKLRELHSYLNPNVIHISRNTILAYCWKEHDRLKLRMRDSLSQVSSRICFTSDCWSSKVTSRGYLSLTAHYIDNNWILRSHILNFKHFPPPHKSQDIYRFVQELIRDWNLEGKAFSMTCDNASSMDVMVSCLKTDLHSRSALPCGGSLLHVRCCAHMLNLIVQSGLSVVGESVVKLRGACRYIDGSDHRLTKFHECVRASGANFKGSLILDCPTCWNSTYLMLKKAFQAKPAFDIFAMRDSNFDFNLSLEEWKVVEFVCGFLEPFYNITCLFSGCEYPTANLYFNNIIAIEKLLLLGHEHEVKCIRDMSSVMMENFEKYWSDYSLLLSIAVMLDPRYKLALVRNNWSHLYVDAKVDARITKVKDAFIELYKFCDSAATSTSSNSVSSRVSPQFSMSAMWETFESNNASGSDALTVVDAYLNAPLVPRSPDFDILKYWQSSSSTYPTLARMAKDVLAVPITSVASESSFSMGSRTLTKYRALLLPKNVEAIVTTQNWLFGYSREEELNADFEVVSETYPDDIDYDSLPLV
ncbi:putative AC transposase [Bienertia sinuspersici]